MKRFIKHAVVTASLVFSVGAVASQEWVKTQLISEHQVKTGAETTAILTNLSPTAIQKGLRDTQLIADVQYDKKSGLLSYTWHSLTKDINGTNYAQALSEPLVSQVKVTEEISNVAAGQELIAKGDIDSMLSDFELLLAKAQEPTEIDASSTLNQETTNEADGALGSGSSDGSGYLGDGGGLTETPQVDEPTLELDEIIEKVEKCSMKVDLTNMIVSNQERVIKTSSKTGEVVEVTECQNVGQANPIRKDFEAGCTVKVEQESGQYIKGFKLYAMVDGSRYDISECEWDEQGINYQVFKDFDTCPLSDALVNADRGTYNPKFVEYTVIDGKRYDLGNCISSDSEVKNLPTRVEMCENYNDLVTNISYEQQRTDTYDPEFKNVLKTSSCTNTGNQYPIERDFEVAQCAALPDYINAKIYWGYQNYYTKEGKKEHFGNCITDMDNPADIFQSVGACSPTENLTDREATINKRWYYNDEDTGEQTFITDCLASKEVYPIVLTEESCSPEYLSDINKVIIKSRDGWQDGTGGWHFVTECRANGSEAEVLTEVCDSPKYEHDFVGGQSYLRSRDYYVYNGERQYISNCSRDTSISFPHSTSTSGCTTQHDDTNLRSRLFTKTLAQLEEGVTELKGCEASNSYIPYVYLSMSEDNWNVFGGRNYVDFNPIEWRGTLKTGAWVCDYVKSMYGGFTYNTVSSKKAYYQLSFYYFRTTAKTYNRNYRRGDGSTYKQVQQKRCYLNGIDPNIGGVKEITLQ